MPGKSEISFSFNTDTTGTSHYMELIFALGDIGFSSEYDGCTISIAINDSIFIEQQLLDLEEERLIFLKKGENNVTAGIIPYRFHRFENLPVLPKILPTNSF